jgi:hypothetical protein
MHAQKQHEHKDTILCAVTKISQQELQIILSNMFTKCHEYLGFVRHNCQHLLQHAVSNIQVIYFNADLYKKVLDGIQHPAFLEK